MPYQLTHYQKIMGTGKVMKGRGIEDKDQETEIKNEINREDKEFGKTIFA